MASLVQTTAPTVEPLSLSNAKDHLNVTDAAMDTYVGGLISAARAQVENDTGRQLITATYDLRLSEFPPGRGEIVVSQPPMSALNEIRYVDPDGDTQTIAKTSVQYVVSDHRGRVSTIVPLAGAVWPSTKYETVNAVTVDFDAGYGDAASDVPAGLVHAMKLLIGWWYETREESALPDRMKSAYEALIAPYKIWEYA